LRVLRSISTTLGSGNVPESKLLKYNQTSEQKAVVEVEGYKLKPKSGQIFAIRGESSFDFVGSQEAYAPPGRYEVWVVDSGVLLSPTKVEVKPYAVGTLEVQMCNRKYTVEVYSDGTYKIEAEDTEPKQFSINSNGVVVEDVKIVLMDGTVVDSAEEAQSSQTPPVEVLATVKYMVPEIAVAQKIGESEKEVQIKVKYDKDPKVEIDGDKLKVAPGICECVQDSKLIVTFSNPRLGESASVELPATSGELSLLQLYLEKVEKLGLLWSVKADLYCSGSVRASTQSLYKYIPKPEEIAQVDKQGLTVVEKPFPMYAESVWCMAPEICTTCESTAVGTFEKHADCSDMSDVAKLLTYRIDTKVYAVTPVKKILLAEWTEYPYKDSEVFVVDVDGQKIPITEKEQVIEAFGKDVGKIFVKPKYYAVVYSEYGTFAVVNKNIQRQIVKYGDHEIRTVPYTVPVPTYGQLSIFDPSGKRAVTLESPLKEVALEVSEDWTWKLTISKASTGEAVVQMSGKFLDGSDSWRKKLAITGVKIDYEKQLDVPPVLSVRPTVTYTLFGVDGNQYILHSREPKIEVKAKCGKSENSVITADVDCMLNSIKVGVVVVDKKPKVRVEVPPWLPSPVLVNSQEVPPGKTVYIDGTEVVLTLGGFQKKYSFESIPAEVEVTEEQVEVVSFGTQQFVEVKMIPLESYAGECKAKKVQLTPDNSVLTKKQALNLFKDECLPKKVLVQAEGKQAIWSYKMEERGKWSNLTKQYLYEDMPMDIIIRCEDAEYKYPDEIRKVKGLCPAYAVLWNHSVYLGKPVLEFSVSEGEDGKVLEVVSDPLYYGYFNLSAYAYVVGPGGRPVLSQIAKEKLENAKKQYKIPSNSFEVFAEATTPFGQKFTFSTTVYGVESVSFVPIQVGGDYEVHVFVILTTVEPKRITLAVITDTGAVIELFSTIVSGKVLKEFVFSTSEFKKKYKMNPVRLRVTVDERAWYFDIEAVEPEATPERVAVSPNIAGILGALLRFLGMTK